MNEDIDKIVISKDALDGVRWTMSPLRSAMMSVESYGTEYKDTRIGSNKGTRLKVIACETLAEILTEITAGKRDQMGYTI